MLETRKIFIDTEYFVKSGLHFDTAAFRTFRDYCSKGELFHISTSVVKREVEPKIESSVREALSAIQTFQRKARLLSTLYDDQIRGLFVRITEEDILEKSQEVFQDFLDGCNTKIIEAEKINVEDVLALYFDEKPPFGEGKKKHEFPDAVSLLSLKSYIQDHEKVYVVSKDGDMEAFCDADSQLIYVDTLDKVLDTYTTHTNARYELVKDYLNDKEDSIKDKIIEYLEECDVWNSSSWEDAEVDDGLSVINLEAFQPSIISITDEESEITFDIEVEFEVTVTGPDFNNGIYDKEDGRTYTFGTTSRTVTISSTLKGEIILTYEYTNGRLENITEEDLFIPEVSRGIEVSVDENDPEHY